MGRWRVSSVEHSPLVSELTGRRPARLTTHRVRRRPSSGMGIRRWMRWWLVGCGSRASRRSPTSTGRCGSCGATNRPRDGGEGAEGGQGGRCSGRAGRVRAAGVGAGGDDDGFRAGGRAEEARAAAEAGAGQPARQGRGGARRRRRRAAQGAAPREAGARRRRRGRGPAAAPLAADQLLQPPVPPSGVRPEDDPAFTQVTGSQGFRQGQARASAGRVEGQGGPGRRARAVR